jgi:hypothetical protein
LISSNVDVFLVLTGAPAGLGLGVEQTPQAQSSPTTPAAGTPVQESTAEIPESVTAELEKLEQDSAMEVNLMYLKLFAYK